MPYVVCGGGPSILVKPFFAECPPFAQCKPSTPVFTKFLQLRYDFHGLTP
jgi:hypothetical protein